MKENRMEFIKKLIELIHMSRSFADLIIEYGYLIYSTGAQPAFHNANDESEIPKGGYECLCLKWQGQDAYYQSIEADSCWAILNDVTNALNRV